MALRKSRLLYQDRLDSEEDPTTTTRYEEEEAPSKPETLFEFFKKKTRFNLNKSLKANMESKRAVASITDTDRETVA